MTVYQAEGYEDRRDYLEHLASMYKLPFGIVFGMALALGLDEDFGKLIDECERYAAVMKGSDPK
ncbi:MAG: hypothetical protein IKH75_00995 [Ruminococcus sp.]|nr:hypothetical protein [Ruminococcus sp.]